METVNLLSIVTIAFLGSFGHCLGMCGGIVVAYSSTKMEKELGLFGKISRHMLYSFGRLSSYTVMGVVFGFLGSVLSFGPKTNGAIYGIAGVMMIVMGISFLGYVKALSLPGLALIGSGKFYQMFQKLLQSKSVISFFGLGVLNGFLPCGLVYFFAVTAASTGDPLWGGVVMLIFGISTIPALVGLAVLVDFMRKGVIRTLFYRLAGISVIFYGIYTLYRAYRFFTIPGLTLLDCH